MSALKVGDQFPEDVVFSYVPYTEDKGDITACGVPQNYNASKEWADKKVVLFAVPGAFTPGCSAKHLPPYIENLKAIKDKGVDVVAVVAFNDAWVMSAWGKANSVKGDDIVGTPPGGSLSLLASKFRSNRAIGGQPLTLQVLTIFVLSQLFFSDPGTKFSQSIGWTMGERTARYAIIVDHGKVTYAEKEPGREVTVSGAEAVMAKL